MKYKTTGFMRDTSSEEFVLWFPNSVLDREKDLSHVSDENIKDFVKDGRLIPVKSKKKEVKQDD